VNNAIFSSGISAAAHLAAVQAHDRNAGAVLWLPVHEYVGAGVPEKQGAQVYVQRVLDDDGVANVIAWPCAKRRAGYSGEGLGSTCLWQERG
jgi:hypothetical protein